MHFITRFRRVWIGLIAFELAYMVQFVASSWLMLQLTASPFWVGLMVGAPATPLLILALPAGAVADMFDRRRVLAASALVIIGASSGMGILWAVNLISPVRLLGLGLTLGVGLAFFSTAWQAIIPGLVPRTDLPNAVGLSYAIGGFATALGPVLGGVLVAVIGPGWTFGVATLGFSAFLLATLSAPSEPIEHSASLGSAISTGLRYLRYSRDYWWLLLLGGLFGFSASALRSMLPNLTSELAGDATLYGLLLGAFGAGAAVGGITRGQGATLLRGRIIPWSIALSAATNALVGISHMIALTLIGALLSGVLWAWVLSTLYGTFQLLTPDWVRGRTMSALTLSVFGFFALGALVSGRLGDSLGASRSLLVFSLAALFVGVAAFKMPLPTPN